MQFLNIYTYQDEKDKSIKIRFDAVQQSDGYYDKIAIPLNLNTLNNGIHNSADKAIMQDVYRCSNTTTLTKALFPSENTVIDFDIKIQTRQTYTLKQEAILEASNAFEITQFREQIQKHKHNGVIFTLSTIPSIALYQIWSFITLVIPRNRETNTTVYFNSSLFNCLQNKGELNSLELSDAFDQQNAVHESKAVTTFLQNILQCGAIEGYQHTFDAIQTVKDHYIEQQPNNGRLLDCLGVEKYSMLLYKPLTDAYFNPKLSRFEKIKYLLGHARTLIAQERKEELNYQINSLHVLAKKQLIAPCLDKLSHEGFTKKNQKTYNANYTELALIKDAEFILREDGRMSITNLQSNPSYSQNYAPGKRNHGGLLKEELQYLGPIIGIELDVDSDFENEIIFTKDCSIKLQDKGLHLTLSYVKSLLYAQNQSLFFTRYSPLNSVPKDLYIDIVDKKMPFDGDEFKASITKGELEAIRPMKTG